MSQGANKLTKNTLFLYIRTGVQLLITLYTSRVLLEALGINDYGIYNVIGGVVVMCAFINSSFSVATQRFLTYEMGRHNFEKLKTVFYTSKIVLRYVAIGIFVVAECVGLWFLYCKMNIPDNRLSAGFWVLQSSIIVMILNILIVPYQASIVANERFTAYAYLGIADVVLKLLLVISLSLIYYDRLITYAVGVFLITLFLRIFYSRYCINQFKECKTNTEFNKDVFKSMLSFSAWTFIGAFSQVCKNQGINVLFNIFNGTVVNAAQGVTSQVNSSVVGFVSNFTTALNPQIIKSYSSQNTIHFYKLIHTGAKLSFLLMALLILPLIYESNFILDIWLVDVPKYTSNFIKLTLCATLIISWSGSVSMAISATGNIRLYTIMLSILNILILPISYIFLKMGSEPTVVYLLYVLVNLLSAFIVLSIANKIIKLDVKYFIRNVILPQLLSIIIVGAILYFICINFADSYVRLFIILFVNSILLVAFSWAIVFDKSEKTLIKIMLLKIYNKIHNAKQ